MENPITTMLPKHGKHVVEAKWPSPELLELLGVTHPIIQAPMSGYMGPALVAAVSNAGALGSLGCGPLPSQAVRGQIEEIRRTSNRPFNLNFFVHTAPRIDAHVARRVRERLAVYYDELGVGAVPEPLDPLPRFDEERLQLVLDLRPRVVSFHFGLPPSEMLTRIKHAGCVVLSSATTVAEAKALEAQGADAIIAQGFEAGGHRGTFTSGGGAGLIGTMALVPQVVDAVRVPVIAAGGIADGRGIADRFRALSRGPPSSCRRGHSADASLHRASRACFAQSSDRRNGGGGDAGVSSSIEPHAGTFQGEWRSLARGLSAFVGGPSRASDPRPACGKADRGVRGGELRSVAQLGLATSKRGPNSTARSNVRRDRPLCIFIRLL
jgi:Nitronate monooxygenase